MGEKQFFFFFGVKKTNCCYIQVLEKASAQH